MKWCMADPDIFRKASFASKTWKMGPNWVQNGNFLKLLKTLVYNFSFYLLCFRK